MNLQVQLVFFLTFVIHLIGTLAYAVRIAGVRTDGYKEPTARVGDLVFIEGILNEFWRGLM